MNEPTLPSDSDSSDEDYCPSGEERGAASEEESGPDDDDEVDDVDTVADDGDGVGKQNGKKSKKKIKKGGKRQSLKRKAEVEDHMTDNETETSKKEEEINPEEQKKKVDSLWADFLKDCGGPAKKKPSLDASDSSDHNLDIINSSSDKESTSLDKKTNEEKENKSTVTQIFEFAGEKIRIEKEVSTSNVTSDNCSAKSPAAFVIGRGRGGRGGGRGGGSSALTSLLGQIGKKGKLSTLEKSKLDWDQFKKNEGIEEDIQMHNKGKDGYLEKQDFLQRTDLRRFEIEKALRQKRSGR